MDYLKDLFFVVLYIFGYGDDGDMSPAYEEDLTAWGIDNEK